MHAKDFLFHVQSLPMSALPNTLSVLWSAAVGVRSFQAAPAVESLLPHGLGTPRHNRWHMWERSPLLLGSDDLPMDCIRSNYHSWVQEDLLLLPYLLALPPKGAKGRFVELGALDGVTWSNSLLLERCFGWTGLLVEGNPASYAKLERRHARGERSARTRIKHSAVCAGVGTVNFTVAGGEMAGEPSHMADGYLRMVGGRNHANETVAVPCSSLTSMMAEAGVLRPEPGGAADTTFLSLDVEVPPLPPLLPLLPLPPCCPAALLPPRPPLPRRRGAAPAAPAALLPCCPAALLPCQSPLM